MNRDDYELETNTAIARALGLRPIAGMTFGIYWDPALSHSRLIPHSECAAMRIKLGWHDHDPGFVFDVFHNPEDLVRAECHFGIVSQTADQRVERILKTIKQKGSTE